MRQRGCPACCLRNQYPVPVRRYPVASGHLVLCSAGRDWRHRLLRMQAACSKVSPWGISAEYRSLWPSLSPSPSRSHSGPSFAALFFLRHKHKMELAGSKNNLSKMAECSRECQAIKQRERAPPAVQQRDPRFLSSLFLNRSKESILQSPS